MAFELYSRTIFKQKSILLYYFRFLKKESFFRKYRSVAIIVSTVVVSIFVYNNCICCLRNQCSRSQFAIISAQFDGIWHRLASICLITLRHITKLRDNENSLQPCRYWSAFPSIIWRSGVCNITPIGATIIVNKTLITVSIM